MGEPLSAEEAKALEQLDTIVREGTYYELLGVDPMAEVKAIQAAYYDLSRKWHPDRFFRRDMGLNGDRLEVVFATITKAYKTLTSDAKRIDYDKEMREKGLLKEGVDGATHRIKATGSGASYSSTLNEDGEAGNRVRARRERPKVGSMHKDRLKKAARARVKKDMTDQKQKARDYFTAGLAELKEGQPTKASSSFHLALQYDPDNEEYKKKFKEVNEQSKTAQSENRLAEARGAKEYGGPKKALVLYRRACEHELDDPRGYKELADLELSVGEDPKAAMKWMKVAIDRMPDNIAWRLEIAELYIKHKNKPAARREFDEVLKRDPANKTAKKGKWRVFF
jgi:curved DNA-binding protein CbpA